MTDPKNEMVQLIFYDLSINKLNITSSEEIDKQVQKSGFSNLGKDYNTIAIIGAQSTGKSTLLNKLFDTNFDVMTTSVGRGQTTKGVWSACHTSSKVFILDCEGTDSKERGEDRHKFEHSSSLFCLAIADVLIINMWTNDVGRYTASNYGVLKIVFEMNLKLFQQECSKKILIVLRDFDSKRNQKSKIQELILQDIRNIWNEIKKPEKYKDSEPSKFFEFEFITLPHKKYCEVEFENEIKELRKRLYPDSSDYVFKHVTSEKNVPADGIKQYINQIWGDIVSEKELNIPSQKEMLSNYRCIEIKEQVLSENDNFIKELSTLSAKQTIEDFRSKCLNIFNRVMELYDKTASNYVDKIYLAVRKQLEANLSQKFFMCFANQAKRIIPISQKFMRIDLEKEIKSSKIFLISYLKGDNFNEISLNIKSKYFKSLLSKLNQIKVFDYWNISQEEYADVFDEIVESQKKICLEEKKNQTIKTLRKEIEDIYVSKLENFSNFFWADFNCDYFQYFAVKMFPLKNYLRDFYNMTEDDILTFAKQIENEVYNSIKKEFSKKTKEISSFAIELFRKKFWFEKDNLPRQWNRLEESEIDALFKKYRSDFADLFDIFKSFRILSPLKCKYEFNLGLRYETLENQDLPNHLKSVIDNIPEILDRESDTFEILMRPNELASMKRKFEDGISSILEDAKRRKSGSFAENLPWWAWLLLIFFGFDDLLRCVTSLWIVPLLLLIGSYFALIHLNMSHIPKNIYYDIEDAIYGFFKKFNFFK